MFVLSSTVRECVYLVYDKKEKCMPIRNDFQHSRATEERTNTKTLNVAIMKQCFKICIILNHGDSLEMFVYHLSFEKPLAQR